MRTLSARWSWSTRTGRTLSTGTSARVQQEGDVTMTLNREGAVEYPLTMGVLEAEPTYTILTNDPAIVSSSASFSAKKAAPLLNKH